VLTRDLGADAMGAFAAGVVYSLGGLSLSSLNLYLFLQALAWGPWVVLALRRASMRGGRSLVAAAFVLAVALSTLALEFVGQVVVLGVVLGLVESPRLAAVRRVGVAIALGVALAGIPLAVTAGLLSGSVRGAGFSSDVALGNAVPLVGLVQVLVPNVFGSLAAPVEAWWGGAFFTKGLPYFLSLYLGPIALSLAWTGLPSAAPRVRVALVVFAAVGLWYSLGTAGGLAPLVQRLPLFASLRFPTKALLLPHLAVAVFAGLGATRLGESRGFSRFAFALAATGGAAAATALVVWTGGPRLAAWAAIDAVRFPAVAGAVAADAVRVALLAAGALAAALAAARGRATAGRVVALVLALLVFDLAGAGTGLNPQTAASFYAPLPEVRALWSPEGRVFSYGLDHSPAFRAYLARAVSDRGLASFYVNRQILAPYNNVLDDAEAAEATDLTSFVPRARELSPADYDPAKAGALVPFLRNASVARVLSLDALDDPSLTPLAAAEVVPGLEVRGYAVVDPWPRTMLACRVVAAADEEDARQRPYAPTFDPARDVALEAPLEATCREGAARVESLVPGDERYAVTTDGPGVLVIRSSFARGWHASVDGKAVPVLRANGKHRAVPVPAGAHVVRLRYDPPGLHAGMALTALGLVGATAVFSLGAGRRSGA
jgi:hypothetical protein